MATDPASLNVTFGVTGLSVDELRALFDHMPNGATWTGSTKQPAIGGTRFEITVSGLSIVGAKNLAEDLHLHLSAIEDGSGR